jgi:hypothetical protein
MSPFLLAAADVDATLADLSGSVTVTQRLPPRLAVVEGSPRTAEALRARPGVLAVGDPDLPAAVRAGLTETERLFADAWALGRQPKERRGDGRSWDAAGFSPPDEPRQGPSSPGDTSPDSLA